MHRADITLHFCHGACQRQWPEGAFDAERLAAWIRNGETGVAKCIRCLAMEANDAGLDKEHQCWQCRTSKPLRHYSPIVLNMLLLDKKKSEGIGFTAGSLAKHANIPNVENVLILNAQTFP